MPKELGYYFDMIPTYIKIAEICSDSGNALDRRRRSAGRARGPCKGVGKVFRRLRDEAPSSEGRGAELVPRGAGEAPAESTRDPQGLPFASRTSGGPPLAMKGELRRDAASVYQGVRIDYGVQIVCARGSYRPTPVILRQLLALGFGGK